MVHQVARMASTILVKGWLSPNGIQTRPTLLARTRLLRHLVCSLSPVIKDRQELKRYRSANMFKDQTDVVTAIAPLNECVLVFFPP